MTSQTELPPTPGVSPLPTPDRVLAPDLARGFALLLVALSHATSIFLTRTPGVDQSPDGIERPYFVVMFVLVHACALPLFGMLLGYGLVQFTNRQESTGQPWRRTRNVLIRRHVWMLVFGAVDGILLYSGDVLGAYGLVGIAFTVLLLRRGNGVYRIAIGYLGFGVVYLAGLFILVMRGVGNPDGNAPVPSPQDGSSLATSYGEAVGHRLTEWPIAVALLSTSILFVWVGAWAARRRILEEPTRNRRLLRIGAIGGFGIAIVCGLPMGLFAGDYLQLDAPTADLAKTMYQGAGLFGAIGYASLFGLIGLALTNRKRPRHGLAVDAFAALGQRTLSGYLFQAVAWLVLAPSFMLGLGGPSDNTTLVAAICAVGVWLISVVAALAMHRGGYRGPAEILLRRLAYRNRADQV